MPTAADRATALLTIDLEAIVSNWRLLQARAKPAEAAAVVKADAYGLGAERVAPALAAAGARTFFVATIDEGVAVRSALTAAGANDNDLAAIFVLGGAMPGCENDMLEYRLIPVLNGLGDIERWSRDARRRGERLMAALHVDTGMSRLGLPADEVDRLSAAPERLDGIDLRYILSHLACADDQPHPLNVEQLSRLRVITARLPKTKVSFANSSGIFLGPEYCFDLVRPGAALYGITPCPKTANPMRQVVRLQGKVLQVREINSPWSVGYGATHRAAGRERIATVAAGYADGLLRSLSNRGSGYVGDWRVPLVGRVSMDLITFDVSEVPASLVYPGALIDLISPRQSVDMVAAAAGTIGYEVLTALGKRYHRAYLDGQS